MQRDHQFYSRYFAGLFVYLHQYKITKAWRGLLILSDQHQGLGSEIPYQDLFNYRVQRVYLQDLLVAENLSPNLALLKLIITPETDVILEAQQILNNATTEAEFKLKLDLVEAILVNKFPQLTIEEVQKMLNLREADVTQTRFYQEVLQIGRREGTQQGVQQGVQQGEANMVIRLLARRCGEISIEQQDQVRSLPLESLETLGEALLDFQGITDLEHWLGENT